MSEAISGALLGVDPAYRSAHAGYLLTADLPDAQAKIAARGVRPIGTTGKSVKPVQPLRKNIPLHANPKSPP